MEAFQIFLNINSTFAQKKKVPPDMLVRFLQMRTRNAILKQQTEKPLIMEGKCIQIFQDLSPRMLRKRKEFTFLTGNKMNNHKDNYRGFLPT